MSLNSSPGSHGWIQTNCGYCSSKEANVAHYYILLQVSDENYTHKIINVCQVRVNEKSEVSDFKTGLQDSSVSFATFKLFSWFKIDGPWTKNKLYRNYFEQPSLRFNHFTNLDYCVWLTDILKSNCELHSPNTKWNSPIEV